MRAWLEARWYGGAPVPAWLAGLEGLYRGLLGLRAALYASGLRRTRHPGRPVVVVGNLVPGGTGKTPVVIALARALAARGLRPGVVSRGYGRRGRGLRWVEPGSDPAAVGDEPLEIRLAAGCPVVVAADRARAASTLVRGAAVDVVLSDDGLQHRRLARDLEIVLMDAARGLGNGRLLPAGPLREPATRLARADFVLWRDGEGGFRVEPVAIRRLADGQRESPESWRGRAVRAAAGIARPERFFAALEGLGMRLAERHPLPDHAPLPAALLAARSPLPLVVTAKDAVKLRPMPTGELWVLEAEARLDPALLERILGRIRALLP